MRLVEARDRLASSQKKLAEVEKLALESENIGVELLSSLMDQRTQLKRVSSTSTTSARENAKSNDLAAQLLGAMTKSRRGMSVAGDDGDDDDEDWDSSDDEENSWAGGERDRARTMEERARVKAYAEKLASKVAQAERRAEEEVRPGRKRELEKAKRAAEAAAARAHRSARIGQSQRTLVTPTDGIASIPVVPRGEGSAQEMQLKEEAARIRMAYEREVGTPFYVGREEGQAGQDAPVPVPVVRPRSTTVYVDARTGGLTRAVLSVLGAGYRKMAGDLLQRLPISLGSQERAEVEMAIYTFVFLFALSGSDEGAVGLVPVLAEQGFDAAKAQSGAGSSSFGSETLRRLLSEDQIIEVITAFAQRT